jgi:hypothetical protein
MSLHHQMHRSLSKNIAIIAGLIILTSVYFGDVHVSPEQRMALVMIGNTGFVRGLSYSNLEGGSLNDEIFQVSPKLQHPIIPVIATTTSSSLPNNIEIDVTSLHYIREPTGQFIKVKGVITNLSPVSSAKGGIAYISIVDIKEKIPVDLEDWSVEKGLYIPSLKPGQSLPLEWDVRLVKAGSYTVDILFNTDGDLISPPIVSSKISLVVDPKLDLNPGNVLPVTFGVPAVLMAILGSINYRRGKKTGVYS